MDEDNSLNITITAVDQASEVIATLGDTVTGLEEQIAPSIESINAEFMSMQDSMSGFSTAFDVSVAAIESSMASLGDVPVEVESIGVAFEETGGLVNTAASQFIDSIQELNSVLGADSSAISDEVLAMGTSWEEAAAAVTTAASEMEDGAAGAETATKGMSLSAGASLIALGVGLQQIGKPLIGFYETAVTGAANVQTAQAGALTSLEGVRNEMKQLIDPTSAVSEQQRTLTDQANNLRAKMEGLEAPTSGYNKTTAQLAATQASHNAQLRVYRDQLDILENKLDLFNNLQKNANINISDAAVQFDTLARSNEKLGLNYIDSMNALSQFTAATGDAQDAEQAYLAAIDLHLAKGMSLADATNMVTQAYEGNGRGLTRYGIIVKDGASGNQALAAIMDQTSTAAKNQGQTMNVALAGVQATWNGFMNDLGQSQSPLVGLLQTIEKIITDIDNWAKAHPKLAEALLIFLGIIGAISTVLGGILILIAPIVIAFALLGATISGVWILIAVGAVALVALLIANWTPIKNFFIKLWTDIGKAFTDAWTFVKTEFDKVETWLESAAHGVETIFTDVWKGIENTFISMVNTIINGINTVIKGVNVLVAVLDKIPGVKNIIGAIPLIPNITAVDDAIISPNGNVITTNPADYLIATTNPGGLLAGVGAGQGGFGGQNIYVNVTGDVLTTSQQALKLGNELARQIGRQLKLTSTK